MHLPAEHPRLDGALGHIGQPLTAHCLCCNHPPPHPHTPAVGLRWPQSTISLLLTPNFFSRHHLFLLSSPQIASLGTQMSSRPRHPKFRLSAPLSFGTFCTLRPPYSRPSCLLSMTLTETADRPRGAMSLTYGPCNWERVCESVILIW